GSKASSRTNRSHSSIITESFAVVSAVVSTEVLARPRRSETATPSRCLLEGPAELGNDRRRRQSGPAPAARRKGRVCCDAIPVSEKPTAGRRCHAIAFPSVDVVVRRIRDCPADRSARGALSFPRRAFWPPEPPPVAGRTRRCPHLASARPADR